MRSNHNITITLLLALLAVGFGGIGRAAADVSKEYQLKAAFLFNFAKFVEWPAQSFADAGSPIVIGMVGSNPFGDALANTVGGRKINGRSIEIRSVGDAASARGAHLLFVSAGEVARFGRIRSSLGRGVLLVGESPQLANQGGIIIFKQVGDKLRFEINMAAADRSGLKISSQLQKLASAVHR